jgi:hypothetical protein
MKDQRPIHYVPVHGTWAIDENELAWWKPTGAFALYSKRSDVIQYDKLPPFVWSSDISGFKYNLASGNSKHTDWRAGGWSLYYYLKHVPLEDRNLIIHSHGLQAVLYCAQFGLELNNIISVCSPIREDMQAVTDVARLRINKWLHIYDNKDYIGWLGQFGDGRFFGSRKAIQADYNVLLTGIHHSEILKVGGRMDLWVKNGWYDFLRYGYLTDAEAKSKNPE